MCRERKKGSLRKGSFHCMILCRKWSNSPLLFHTLGISRISRSSKESLLNLQKWTFLKDPFQKTPFSDPESQAYLGQRRKNIHNHHRKRTFLASKKNFPGQWWIQETYKTKKSISTTEIFPLWTQSFSAKKSSALEQGGVCFPFPSWEQN